jgi:hypothetical protein
MPKYTIDIDIRPDGSIGFGVKGVKGRKCQELTKELEEALGDVISTEKTAEFYVEEVVEEKKTIQVKK